MATFTRKRLREKMINALSDAVVSDHILFIMKMVVKVMSHRRLYEDKYTQLNENEGAQPDRFTVNCKRYLTERDLTIPRGTRNMKVQPGDIIYHCYTKSIRIIPDFPADDTDEERTEGDWCFSLRKFEWWWKGAGFMTLRLDGDHKDRMVSQNMVNLRKNWDNEHLPDQGRPLTSLTKVCYRLRLFTSLYYNFIELLLTF